MTVVDDDVDVRRLDAGNEALANHAQTRKWMEMNQIHPQANFGGNEKRRMCAVFRTIKIGNLQFDARHKCRWFAFDREEKAHYENSFFLICNLLSGADDVKDEIGDVRISVRTSDRDAAHHSKTRQSDSVLLLLLLLYLQNVK